MSAKSFEHDDISADESHIQNQSEISVEINSKIKSYLLSKEIENGKSIFSHLTSCIRKILEERSNDVLDVFENISRSINVDKSFNSEFQDLSIDVGLAEIQRDLFSKGEGNEEEAVLEDDVETPLPNMMLHAYFYEQAGIGFNREELHRIWLAMKTLVNTQPVEHARFWGKIFGIQQNYYVAEVEFREGEELEEEEEEEAVAVEEERSESKLEGDEEIEDLPPKSVWKPLPPVPKEEFRTGTNKKIYFVCNEPGKPWIRLPHVTPAQIQAARQIKKLFVGSLDAAVKSFPLFPGLEMNLLRAQIARISSGTQISPIGFYTFDNEEEEEAEEEGNHDNYIENQDYVPSKIKELIDPILQNWVHHTQHILPQGRCIWWNPKQKNEDELEEEEDQEVEEEVIEPEKGPSLLTPISHDASVAGIQPWSVRLSSTKVPEYAVVTVTSNHWPGAHTFAFGKHFQNIYIGWGCKNQGAFTPRRTQPIMTEFVENAQTKECADPTSDQERELKAAQSVPNAEEQQEEEEEEND